MGETGALWCVERHDGEALGRGLAFPDAQRTLYDQLRAEGDRAGLRVYREGRQRHADIVNCLDGLIAWVEKVKPQLYTVFVRPEGEAGSDEPQHTDQRSLDAVLRWVRDAGHVQTLNFATLRATREAIQALEGPVTIAVRLQGTARGSPAYAIGPMPPRPAIFPRLRLYLLFGTLEPPRSHGPL